MACRRLIRCDYISGLGVGRHGLKSKARLPETWEETDRDVWAFLVLTPQDNSDEDMVYIWEMV